MASTCREAEAERERRNNEIDRVRRSEVTDNVRAMAVDGKYGVSRAAEILGVYQRIDCDMVGLPETRRSGQSALRYIGHDIVYCSGES